MRTKLPVVLGVVFVVGVAFGVVGIVVLNSFAAPGVAKTITQLSIKAIGLCVTLIYAKFFIIKALEVAKVPLPDLSETERAVGITIGYIERLLAYCFVLDGADNAIAMLIAAKGVYRLHELGIGKASEDESPEEQLKADNKTYYIMIGTFTSIAFAIVVALAARFVAGLIEPRAAMSGFAAIVSWPSIPRVS